jgi:hypothetical protein
MIDKGGFLTLNLCSFNSGPLLRKLILLKSTQALYCNGNLCITLKKFKLMFLFTLN